MSRAPVVDVHTHMLTKEWVSLLEQHGGRYTLKEVLGGLRAIHLDGSPFMTPVPNMFDWEARIANMNKARVDIAITSLSCPNVFWGNAEVSLKAARVMNDDMARAQKTWHTLWRGDAVRNQDGCHSGALSWVSRDKERRLKNSFLGKRRQ